MVRQAARLNSLSEIALTKLDVLDGLSEILLCTGYRLDGRDIDILPLDADDIARCQPRYERMPGWSETTAGLTRWEQLPRQARAYLERVAELSGTPIAMVSTGPDRDHTIVLQHPFGA
jgi:adenylosuccinate synthase